MRDGGEEIRRKRVVAGGRGIEKTGGQTQKVNNGGQRRGQEEEQDRTGLGGGERPDQEVGGPGNKRGGDMCASEWVAPALGIVLRSAGRTLSLPLSPTLTLLKKKAIITKIQNKIRESDCPGYE